MQLSEIGKITQTYWHGIPNHFPFMISDAFVVMPNPIHGIIIINKNDDGRYNDNDQRNDANGRDAINRVSTGQPSSNRGGITGNNNPMLHKNLSKIIRWYKGRVTFECRKIHTYFGWQSRFYDHIIRNNESFEKIKSYIINNPLNWHEDKFNNTNERQQQNNHITK